MCEIETETKIIKWKTLGHQVLVVASITKVVDEWAVYVGAVEGKDHEGEWEEVLRHGDKVPEEVGNILFPEFVGKYKWRN